MAWSYRRSVKIAPGIRLNLSKRGIGYSFGVKGYRITKSANGRLSRTISIPGTGLYERETIHGAPQSSATPPSNPREFLFRRGMFKSSLNQDFVSQDEILVPVKPRIFLTLILGYFTGAAIMSNFGLVTPWPNKFLNAGYTILVAMVFALRVYRHKTPRLKKVQRIVVKNPQYSELTKNENE